MRTLGICIGAATLQAVEAPRDDDAGKAALLFAEPHGGDPRAAVSRLCRQVDLSLFHGAAVTGRKLRQLIALPAITEVEATEHALQHLSAISGLRFQAVASLGAENFIVYRVDGKGTIVDVESDNKCASGTGEFFMQMLRRMNLEPDAAMRLAGEASPHPVSGRCSVFCKSDCTHALNVGHPVGEVTAGLCQMMAEKIARLIRRSLGERQAGSTGDGRSILVVGGVTRNRVLVRYLSSLLPSCTVMRESPYFEALGAALWARGLEAAPRPRGDPLVVETRPRFDRLPPLSAARSLVTFHEGVRGVAAPGAEHVLGLDVGSTTTKATLVRLADDAVIASEYLRTLGDPVGASRRCYESLLRQAGDDLAIVALGVTGSGRHIAGLHAMTDAVVNEIVAHATAAAHFDPEVDTILEIGGQDAKYTYLVNGVPCDYAMNEACSAGTGSFLEESARETLGVDVQAIADHALRAPTPAAFSDQCAAFISSDLKLAMQEGVSLDDMLAGLVYSICINYDHKVRSNRPVGRRIFMQGGVCYNRAVPVAMAALVGKPIAVPPDPGLCGAFGVALVVKRRLELGLLQKAAFQLSRLAKREVSYGRSFTCRGGGDPCDRGCLIQMTILDGKEFPFGGSCDKYYNRRIGRRVDATALDLVAERERLVFQDFRHDFSAPDARPTIGMNRSFFIHTYFPFFSHCFGEMGLRLVLPEKVDPAGLDRAGAPFCLPAELAHGYYHDLLQRDVDHIFLPQVSELPVPGRTPTAHEQQSLCVTAQAEPYLLRAAFRDLPRRPRVHEAVLDLSGGLAAAEKPLLALAESLGVARERARTALARAIRRQDECEAAMRARGAEVLAALARDPEASAVVLFGRAYSAFAPEANMGIPRKFASRGTLVIPVDFLDVSQEPCDSWMHWATGHVLLRAARLVARHPQLFGAWISNFSCGPDSFLLGWYRDAMGRKPCLTLELDQHTADAGINTRIDAFLDIIQQHRVESRHRRPDPPVERLAPARVEMSDGRNGALPEVVDTNGQRHSLRDPRVHILVPPMGDLGSQLLASAFRGFGIRASDAPVPDQTTLQTGRGCTSCKECLPLTLCAGALLQHLERRPADEITAYFLPRADGNCRFGQYAPFLEHLAATRRIPRLALLTLSSQNNYEGLGQEFWKRVLDGVLLADAMRDIRNAVRALARDRTQGMEVFAGAWRRIRQHLETGAGRRIEDLARSVADDLRAIPLHTPFAQAKRVLLVGEIYLRSDEFSCNGLGEWLADRGLVMKTASLFEWLRYVEWLTRRRFIGPHEPRTLNRRLRDALIGRHEASRERQLKAVMRRSGLYDGELLELEKTLDAGSRFVDPHLTGEPILVTGSALREILHTACGVISIGPFACLPSRVCEALLKTGLTVEQRYDYAGSAPSGDGQVSALPFLAIDADGRPFPPLIEARLEAFALQANRLGEFMVASRAGRERTASARV